MSATPATRLDVCALQEQLEVRLQQREARETGICPIRRELYSQCFDELIRQVSYRIRDTMILLIAIAIYVATNILCAVELDYDVT